ncbi:GNAT family N-acetyltransferase [Methylocella sp.]|uniref:GNAT family N-acetyltransferase n=1 Tax=Methylocella sp. TaxID=1978226 RepID=UPI00378481ED
MKLSIRSAAQGDGALIFSLVKELADYEKLSHEVRSSEADIRAALFGEPPRAFGAIAQDGDEAAGFALWFYTFSSFRGRCGIWLEDLYVRPAFRGRGFGKALISHVAGVCVAETLGRFEWSVLDWNAPSIAFYESLGAKLMRDWRICRVEDEALARLAAS